MAKMIDRCETGFYGERIVWEQFHKNLPDDFIVYFNRAINTYETDFIVLAKGIATFIVEVKGWDKEHIDYVDHERYVHFKDGEKHMKPQDPRRQVKGYSNNLINKFNDDLKVNPTVLGIVCYPKLSFDDYMQLELNRVSEEVETIFKEDLYDPTKLMDKLTKYANKHRVYSSQPMDDEVINPIRIYFEGKNVIKELSNYKSKPYSVLQVIHNRVSKEDANTIINEYLEGTKKVLFVKDKDDFNILKSTLDGAFQKNNIQPNGFDLSLINDEYKPVKSKENELKVFNFELYQVNHLDDLVKEDLEIKEGQMEEYAFDLLNVLQEETTFNVNQYLVEHAPIDKNISVKAGAGTGKTYSMVSRIAYLCNKEIDRVNDIKNEIAMITFTNEASINMLTRIKQMFMNYFVLTNHKRYIDYIDQLEQMQVKTIHKFSLEFLRQACFYIGLGKDFEISNESFEKKELYHKYLNDYISEKCKEDKKFEKNMTMRNYELEKYLMDFSSKLYSKSIDLREISQNQLGRPPKEFEYFNELFFAVVLQAENEYGMYLQKNNELHLERSMVELGRILSDDKCKFKNNYHFKYVFVDEFQDTDDMQIKSIIALQELFGEECKLFVVGDLKQSIYRFRGAKLSAFNKLILNKDEWYEQTLNINYRTDSKLLDCYKPIFELMGAHDYLPYQSAYDELISPINRDVTMDHVFKCVNLKDFKVEDEKNDDLKYKVLFDEVKEQIAYLEQLEKERKLSSKEKTIAILVRNNSEIQNIINKLKNQKDQYSFIIETNAGGNLYELEPATDLLKLTKALTNPNELVYLVNLLESNYVDARVDFSCLNQYPKDEKKKKIVTILDQYFMNKLNKTWNELVMAFRIEPVLSLLREVYEKCAPYHAYSYTPRGQEFYKINYEALMEIILGHHNRTFLTLNSIHDHLNISIQTHVQAASRQNENQNDIKVICSTVHKSKGLEYGIVILPFTNNALRVSMYQGMNVERLDDGTIAYAIQIERNQKAIENEYYTSSIEEDEVKKEESRVLYVAMTRAINTFIWMKPEKARSGYCWSKVLEGQNVD